MIAGILALVAAFTFGNEDVFIGLAILAFMESLFEVLTWGATR